MAPITKEFVGTGPPGAPRAGPGSHPCQGIYYKPEGVNPKVALIATHYQLDFSEHYLGELLAAHGIGFLGWNTRFRGFEWNFVLDQALVDIGVGVRWLRDVAKVETVILLGNSGGGSLMGAYQSQAIEPCVQPARDGTLAAGVDDLVPADAYISLAAHTGRAQVMTDWMDASVTDERDITSTDPELDPFNPKNGPPFSPEFVERYRAAQVARNHRITDWCIKELERINALGIRDAPFCVYRVWADLRMIDPAIEPSERRPGHCYRGPTPAANRSGGGLGSQTTLRNWLGMWSLKETQCHGEPHLAKVTVPTLVINATGDEGVFESDAKRIEAALAAKDLTRHDIKADHFFVGPEGAREELAGVIAKWVGERFALV